MNIEKKLENEDIYLSDLFSAVWRKKFFIIIITFIFGISAVFYSLSLENKYTSQATLVPTAGSNTMMSLANQYSGLASLAGVSMPVSNEIDETALSIEIIESYDFFVNLVSKYDLLAQLVAVKSWDQENNLLFFHEDEFKNGKWVSEKPFSIDGVPSFQLSHKTFLSSLNIERDLKTNFITIAFEHVSPHVAKEFLEKIIIEVNEINRKYDIDAADRSINFLKKEIQGTQLSEIKIGLNSLVQKQIETKMLANVTQEYAFRIASAPIAPEIKSGPSRSIICIMMSFLGAILSIFYVIVRFIYKKTA